MYNQIDDTFDLLDDPPTVEEIIVYATNIDVSKNSSVVGIKYVICKDLLLFSPEYFF